MWLNDEYVNDVAIANYRQSLLRACPNHIVIDGLFNEAKVDEVVGVLQQPDQWKTQQHTYSALYVDNVQWQNTRQNERFVQRDVWQRDTESDGDSEFGRENGRESGRRGNKGGANVNVAQEFLSFLRGDEFMSLLSRMFAVPLTDINVAEPSINTNYFRLAPKDFVGQHADDSPGREVCMLLYLNKDWSSKAGGELSFLGANAKTSVEKNVEKSVEKSVDKDLDKDSHNSITIAPLYNRCVLFDPSSTGSEHWVEKLHAEYADQYRYNVTSWYWAE